MKDGCMQQIIQALTPVAIVFFFSGLASSVVSAGLQWEPLPSHEIPPPTEKLETILLYPKEISFIQSTQVPYWKGVLSSLNGIHNKYMPLGSPEGCSKIAPFWTSLSSNTVKISSEHLQKNKI